MTLAGHALALALALARARGYCSLVSYRVSHDTGHLENLAKSQALYKHGLDWTPKYFLSA